MTSPTSTLKAENDVTLVEAGVQATQLGPGVIAIARIHATAATALVSEFRLLVVVVVLLLVLLLRLLCP